MTTEPGGARVIDKAAALERIGGDTQLLKEIAVLFVEEYPGLLQAAREAFSRGDAAALERAAHTLKGSASNFGAYSCVEAALTIERQARAGDLNAARAAFPNLEEQIRLLHNELLHLASER